MTLTVVATADMWSTEPPRVRLDVNSTVTGSRPASVTRTHADGTVWPVITDAPPRLSAGSWVGFDYHAPANGFVTYTATSGAETGTSNTVSLVPDRAWLHHPADPTLSVPILFVPEDGFGDEGTDDKSGVFDIIGSDMAVSVSDETLRSTGSIKLAFTPDQVPALKALRRAGGPLLFNAPENPLWPFTWRWMQPTGWTVSVPGKTALGGNAGYPHRILSIPHVVVDQPVVNQVAVWDFTDLANAFTNFTTAAAGFADFNSMATNTRP